MWYRKRVELMPDTVRVIGADVNLWHALCPKVHIDDMEGLAAALGVPPQILIEVLYEPCDPPKGMPEVN